MVFLNLQNSKKEILLYFFKMRSIVLPLHSPAPPPGLSGRSEPDHLLTYLLCLLLCLQVSMSLHMGEALSLTSWLAPEGTLSTAFALPQPHLNIQCHHGGGCPNALHHSGLRHLCLAVGGLSWYRPLLRLLWRAPTHNTGRQNKDDFHSAGSILSPRVSKHLNS